MKYFWISQFYFLIQYLSIDRTHKNKSPLGLLIIFLKYKEVLKTKFLRRTNLELWTLKGPLAARALERNTGTSFHSCPQTTSACPQQHRPPRAQDKKREKETFAHFLSWNVPWPASQMSHPVLPNKPLWRFPHNGKCWQCLGQSGMGREVREMS